jgi:transposase
MTPTLLPLQYERVDDIPFLFGVVQQLRLPELFDCYLGTHHLHQGISNGLLAATWITFILSEANHCKVDVQDWAQRHHYTLQTLLQQSLRPIEFSDDRLSIVLARLHHADWQALERDLWQSTCEVYQIPTEGFRLDTTTSYGYHHTTDEGLMQFGHSKDHRPDLPQLKLMAAAAQPTSHTVACDIVPGNVADDVLYLPLIERIRSYVGGSGLLYMGDKKMSALETRADIAKHQDYYLTLLPRTGDNPELIDTWIEEALAGKHPLKPFYQRDKKTKQPVLFAQGGELVRTCKAKVGNEQVVWKERVQLVRTEALYVHHGNQLERRLQEAMEQVRRLTPPVGRGQRQYREAEELQKAVAETLAEYEVAGLLEVTWEREEYGKGKVRYQITGIRRDARKIAARKERLGWRVQVTNLEKDQCDLWHSIELYNGGWSLERDWHLVKDKPLGIQPMYVQEDDQIDGLTKLLMIALRVMTYLEMVVRRELAEAQEELPGLYPGQPKRKTARPTAVRILKAIVRMEITVVVPRPGKGGTGSMTALPPLLDRLLALMHLPGTLYTQFASDTG